MGNVSAQKAIVDGLLAYIQAQIGNAFAGYLPEFPSSQKLVLPALSAIIAKETFTPTTADEGTVGIPDPVTQQAVIQYLVGRLTLDLQLDIFAPSKLARSVLEQVLVQVLNPDPDSGSGLKITLAAYYNQVASFVLSGGGAQDDAVSAQTNEWRCRMMVTADCDVVTTGIQSLLEEIDLYGQVQDIDGSNESDFTETVN